MGAVGPGASCRARGLVEMVDPGAGMGRGAAVHQGGGKLDREIYQNSSSWCIETLANICISV